MARRPPEVDRFARVAWQRLADADFLHKNGATTSAIYLAGYAVECILKAVLLSTYPVRKHPEVCKAFLGKRGHDFEWLKKEYLSRRAAPIPDSIAMCIRKVSSWSTDIRYEPGRRKATESEVFLNLVKQVVKWGASRLP